jgi:DNA-directed RNA polymerase specialized sigma24 family protein
LHAVVDVLTQEVEREETLTQVAFTRLLGWLDDGADSGGETYLEMRRRLVTYFDRRNRPAPDALADETFNRIGKTLEKSGSIATTPPARYCYVVARFVLLEDLRQERRYVPFDEVRGTSVIEWRRTPVADAADASARERRFECLDCCLRKLKPDQRELVVDYYGGAERQRIDRRRDLAARLGISMNALAIRVCRIRGALETCVDVCCKAAVKGFQGSTPIRAGRRSG